MDQKREIKKLTKLKLNQLSRTELDQRAMNVLKGGDAPGCSCYGTSNCRKYWKS